MNSENIIKLAREAGLFTHKEVQPEIERFAELVRADEREACAQLCEDEWQTAHEIQDAIRARGNT